MVSILRDDWLLVRIMADLLDKEYHLKCGLVIPVYNICYSEFSWDHYIIYFAQDADATWFILNHGGTIIS